MVPTGSVVMMAVNAVMGIGVPVVLAWWLVKKHHANVNTILIGAGVFFVFALLLEPILHQVVLKGPHGATITGNVWYYALYGGLAAGIFEETGRFLAMKFLLKKEPAGAITPVAYGVGHGGLEMIMIFGLSMISNLVLSAMINAGQMDTLLSASPADARGQLETQLSQLETVGIGALAMGLWERASALILQLGLSVMVWAAVRRGGKWLWLFPAAILLHALVDGVAVILSKSVPLWATETVILAMALSVGAIGYLLGRTLNRDATSAL